MRIEQKIRRAKASMFEAQQEYAVQLSLGPAQVPETLMERGNLSMEPKARMQVQNR